MQEFALANIVRVDVTTTTATHSLTDVATQAEAEGFVSEGAEDMLRVKNTIKALNRFEDILMGFNITLTTATMVPEILALIDGGTLRKAAEALAEVPVGLINEINKAYALAHGEVVEGSVSIIVDGAATAITDDGGDLSDGGTINYETGAIVLNAAPATTITVTYKYASLTGTGDFVDYEAPEVGKVVSRTPFTMEVYTADKDVDGDDKGYIKFVFLNCVGTPINYSMTDQEFFVPEMTIKSRPKSGEKPVRIVSVKSLPA